MPVSRAPAPAGTAVGALLCLALLAAPALARAQDVFEIQVYDSETAPAGEPGIELHLNHAAAGTRTRTPQGELPTAHVTHLTFEPHLGVAGFGEVGLYVQTALRPEGAFDYAGLKLRFKAHAPRLARDRLGLAANFELSALPPAYEAGRYAAELRPIVDWRSGALYASVNPILSFSLTQRQPYVPYLEPAAKVGWTLAPRWAAGAEYYGGWGPLDALAPGASATHQLFAAADFTGRLVDVNLGLGYAFGVEGGFVAKAILGLHPPAP